ncbi:MAG TPA: hypothetical protein VFV89_00820 [Nocardioides sp.]|uniref:hypothetical protein n=1 Tax=Nocardioides sp. TaxID=35761 RepID=UPI002E351502|nr:hypothetical protein [Nocardioides sp.]HEX5086319.1 hypothetical protein [Nocardioides sp.]
MRIRPFLAAAAVAAATVIVGSPSPSAHAAFVGKDNFTDTGVSEVYDCDGTRAQDAFDVHVIVSVVERHGLFYVTESNHGTVVTTNLSTGRTFTQVFANNFHDKQITDHGDGIITVVQQGAGGTRYYDDTGKLVLKDPGSVRFAFDFDTITGEEVPDSFHIVKPSTGNSDFSDRNFCDDLRTFTS